MSRRYDDPIEVRQRDGEPAEFLWRTRLYVVQTVLSRWVETAAWWQAAAVAPTEGSSALTSDLASAALRRERELWRVAASRGRVHGTGVFDLCFDWSPRTGTGWTLARTLD